MRRLFVLLLALALPGTAQQATKLEQTPPPAQYVQKIIEIKHADVERVSKLVGILGAVVKADAGLRVIAVNGPKETVAAIEEAVKRLDVPPPPQPNIELTVYLLFASGKADGGSEPAELAPAIKQLRALFPYKSYRVLETLVMRGRDGQGGDLSGVLPWPSDPLPSNYNFRYRAASLSASGNSRVVRLDGMRIGVRVRVSNSYIETGMSTDVDVREGQKVVVGKSNISGGDDALIVVITAKVVE